jgi:hypothetical protein
MAATAKGLTGGGPRQCSRAQDLAVAALGARGEDGEPYPGWHKAAEGHGRSGDGEVRQRLGELGGGAFGARRKGKEVGLSSAVERLRRGHLYIGPGGGGEEGRRSPVVMEFQCSGRFGRSGVERRFLEYKGRGRGEATVLGRGKDEAAGRRVGQGTVRDGSKGMR